MIKKKSIAMVATGACVGFLLGVFASYYSGVFGMPTNASHLQKLEKRLVHMTSEQKRDLLARYLLDNNYVYRLFPGDVKSDEDGYIWGELLSGRLRNLNSERLCLIEAIANHIETSDKVSSDLLRVGRELLYETKASRAPVDPIDYFDMDPEVLLDELREEKRRINAPEIVQGEGLGRAGTENSKP